MVNEHKQLRMLTVCVPLQFRWPKPRWSHATIAVHRRMCSASRSSVHAVLEPIFEGLVLQALSFVMLRAVPCAVKLAGYQGLVVA